MAGNSYTINHLCQSLERFAPQRLAEDWDNVGLLVGDRTRTVERIMTALTITPPVVEEAVAQQADLIIAHHPMPFRAVKRITRDSTVGSMLLDLIAANISVYSPHTSFDSCAGGINQQIATRLELQNIQPLKPFDDESEHPGAGRWGTLSQPLSIDDFSQRLAKQLNVQGLHRVAATNATVRSVAVACGSAGEFLSAATRLGCDTFVTGETNFHTSLEAKASGVSLLLPGHYASERFAVESLATQLQSDFPDLTVWASGHDLDPLDWWTASPDR